MKLKTTIITGLLLLFAAFATYAQNGKLVGKVTDLETGEPLIGANVLIEGTTYGAATDVNGNYIILNVPPNTYTLTCKYIGYRAVTKSNIIVSGNVTTEENFKLPSQTYELGTVEIVAPKPLVNKNLTNSVNIVRSEDIENLPVRGVNSIVSTQAGVVNQGGTIYVRGGRSDAVAYYVDGVLVNDPVFGGATTLGIQDAIQEIQFQAGGYPAEYGGANAGIISTTTKIGGEKYKFSFEGITDNFSKVGKKFLGGYSYGYSELIATASGPVTPAYKKLRFFIAGSNQFNRSPIAYYEGANFKNLYDPGLAAAGAADTFDVVYPDGYIENDASNTYNVQGNLSWDLNPFTIKLNGSLRYNKRRLGVGLTNFNTVNRAGQQETQTITASLKITQVLNEKAFYDVIVDYFSDFNKAYDPIFKDNIIAYGDSVLNAEVGDQMRSDGQYPVNLSAFGFNFVRSERPYNNYTKNRSDHIGGKASLLYQIGQHHELKTGVDFTYYTIRRYSVAPVSIALQRRANPEGENYDLYRRPDNYGYDVFGNTLDSGLFGAKHPIFAAYYIQDKMEFSDLVVNAGLRLDYINIDVKEFKDPHNVQFDQNDQLDPAGLQDVKPITQVSPRLGLSFPVTDKTVFHAQYGKFIQQSRLRDVYQGYYLVADNIKGGYAIQNPVGFGLRPERTTQYELGFKQQIGETFAFDITGFYKDIKDQIQERSIYADPTAQHRQYYAWVNGDFSTVKGIEFKFDLRRTERVAATFDYTFSDAQGTGSNPSSSFRQIWQSPTSTPYFPMQIAPLDFNQAHKGNLNIDYRFANNDGPELFGGKFLQNSGINLLFSFASGFNYTRWDNQSFGNRRFPTEPLNASTTPWTFQLDAKVDKAFSVGPLRANIYLWVINVLNTKNVVNVFNVSGDAYDDGWLSSPQGSSQVESLRNAYGDEQAQRYIDLYKAMTYSAGNFGTPRQIRLGIRLNY